MEFYSGDITTLKENEIFVYGANPEFRNGKGAALQARSFGAKAFGGGRGIVGQTYGLVTKNLKPNYLEKETGILYTKAGEKSLTKAQISDNILELYKTANNHKDKRFLIAYKNQNSNLNGYSSEEIFELFVKNKDVPNNIIFNDSFKSLVNKYMNNNQINKVDEITQKWIQGANAGQAEAIGHINGPAVLVAGAGAGKTFTMLNRAANLIDHGVPPRNVMIVTFTNQAANEIKERMGKLLGERGEDIITGTFHSVALRLILKKYAQFDNDFLKRNDLKPDFGILDQDDAKKTFREVLKRQDERFINNMEDYEISLNEMVRKIGLWRSRGYNDPDYILEVLTDAHKKKLISIENSGITEKEKDLSAKKEKIMFLSQKMSIKLWKDYRDENHKNLNAIDFDEILNLTYDFLKNNDDVLRILADEFKYIMIDEFQDTNKAQMNIVNLIRKYNDNICVVGDPRQSIYKFRGADVKIIENLDFKRIYMLTNYRSLEPILKSANLSSLNMENEMCRAGLEATDNNKKSTQKPLLVTCSNDQEETDYVINLIEKKRVDNPEESISILYRSRKHKDLIEQELTRKNIPFQIIGDTSFFDRSEVKDALKMARFMLFPNDISAGLRFIDATNRLRISEDSVREKIEASGGRITPFSYLESLSQGAVHSRKIIKTDENGEIKQKSGGKVAENCKDLMNVIQYMQSCHSGKIHPNSVYDDLMKVWEYYLHDKFKKKYLNNADDGGDNYNSRVENVKLLFDRIKSEMLLGKSLELVFEELSLLIDNTTGVQNAHEENPVKLMTIHASKGLEFDTVISIYNDHGETERKRLGLIRTNDKNLSKNDLAVLHAKYKEELEEERRIFYTCITRAKSNLFLTQASSRKIIKDGGFAFDKREPSIFLKEIKPSVDEMTYKQMKKDIQKEKENDTSSGPAF